MVNTPMTLGVIYHIRIKHELSVIFAPTVKGKKVENHESEFFTCCLLCGSVM